MCKDFRKIVDITIDNAIFVIKSIKMTDKIQLIIEEIRLKCKDLHMQLDLERSKRITLETELENSKAENFQWISKNEE